MSDDRLPSIDKLDSTNWPIWKEQIKNYFVARRLWKLCQGTVAVPVRIQGETEDVWVKREEDYQVIVARVKSVLLQTISTQFLHLVVGHNIDTPKKAWDALVAHFERPSLSNKLTLKSQLFGLKMQPGSSVESHLKFLSDLVEKLAALGSPVPEEDQVCLLLSSMPEETFGTLKTAYFAKGEVSMSELCEALVAHEQRLSLGGPDNSSALTSVASGQSKTIGPCFGCGKPGHIQRDCRNKPTRGRGRGGNYYRRNRSAAQKHVKQIETNNCSNNSDHNSGGAFCTLYGANFVQSNCVWVIDSGATSHITCDSSILSNYHVFDVPQQVTVADGNACNAVGVGTVFLYVSLSHRRSVPCILNNVLFVPGLHSNFFSVHVATKTGHSVNFQGNQCLIKNSKGQLKAAGHLNGQLYLLNCVNNLTESDVKRLNVVSENKLDLWHQRLGHCGIQRLKDAVRKNLVRGVAFPVNSNPSFCDGCAEGKQSRKHFPDIGGVRTKRRLELVHSDVCGPMSESSLGGS